MFGVVDDRAGDSACVEDVCEFEADVSSSDEECVFGECVEVEYVVARCEVFCSGDGEGSLSCSGCDDESVGDESEACDPNRVLVEEACSSVDDGDSCSGEVLFDFFGPGHAPLFFDESLPVDRCWFDDAVSGEVFGAVGEFCSCAEDFFGVASAVQAGTSVGVLVDDRDAHSSFGECERSCESCWPSSDYYDLETTHLHSPSPRSGML